MLRMNWKTAAFTIAGLGLMAPVQGDQVTDMQAQIDVLRAELSQVKAEQSDNWLNERRAEEVKGLIMEVLSDADTRASLLDDGAVAGYGENGFFLASQDGAFAMYISGQLQFRYIYNQQDDKALAPGGDEDEGGFQTRRAKLNFDGHVSSPKIGYHVVLAYEYHSLDGDIGVEEYNVSYAINDQMKLSAGNMKLPFLREELIDSSQQLAVERSTTNEFFSIGRSEGVMLTYGEGHWALNVMLSDGANSGVADFDEDTAETAVTARYDHAFEGDLAQGEDFTGWSGEGQSIILGGALHWELGDGRNGGEADYFAHTVDLSYENEGFNAYAAYIGAHISPDSGSVDNRRMTGFLAQAGLDIVPDKFEVFGRYAYIDGDVDGEDEANTYTAGVNYYVNGHKAKLTADVIWLGDDLPTMNAFGGSDWLNGMGLITGTEDEVAVRTQFQLLF